MLTLNVTSREPALMLNPSRSLRYRGLLIVLIVGILSPAGKASPGNWARLLIPIGHGPAAGVSFTIRGYTYMDGVLSADGWFSYTQHTDPVILHGQQDAERRLFRPVVTYEIATEEKTKWRKLQVDSSLLTSDTITVSPDSPIAPIIIDMKPFQEWIGTYRYGRVALENGDAAIIALEDLLPTADVRDDAGNFKQDASQGRGGMLKHDFKLARSNDPAVLSNVVSLGGQLIAEFIFDPRSETTSLAGTRTLDGDFWPVATFYGGNSLTEWKEIGKSQNNGTPCSLEFTSGKAESVRFLFTKYKVEIAEYKYCKIRFANGQSTVFYADLLDPKG
jgi:hypothetical protein